eukprot:7431765-Alexandrium_andersonii.AAC.1
MSASLVGSEMCIRDRAGYEFRPMIYAHIPYRTARAPFCKPTRRMHDSADCLLYTSDAADDM